jgi:hypothetical protein
MCLWSDTSEPYNIDLDLRCFSGTYLLSYTQYHTIWCSYCVLMLLAVTAKFNFFVFFPFFLLVLSLLFLLLHGMFSSFRAMASPLQGVRDNLRVRMSHAQPPTLEGQGVYLCPAPLSNTVRRQWPYQQLRLSPAYLSSCSLTNILLLLLRSSN